MLDTSLVCNFFNVFISPLRYGLLSSRRTHCNHLAPQRTRLVTTVWTRPTPSIRYSLTTKLTSQFPRRPVPYRMPKTASSENFSLPLSYFYSVSALIAAQSVVAVISHLDRLFILKVRFSMDGINGDGFSPYLQTVKPVLEITHGSTKPS